MAPNGLTCSPWAPSQGIPTLTDPRVPATGVPGLPLPLMASNAWSHSHKSEEVQSQVVWRESRGSMQGSMGHWHGTGGRLLFGGIGRTHIAQSYGPHQTEVRQPWSMRLDAFKSSFPRDKFSCYNWFKTVPCLEYPLYKSNATAIKTRERAFTVENPGPTAQQTRQRVNFQ